MNTCLQRRSSTTNSETWPPSRDIRTNTQLTSAHRSSLTTDITTKLSTSLNNHTHTHAHTTTPSPGCMTTYSCASSLSPCLRNLPNFHLTSARMLLDPRLHQGPSLVLVSTISLFPPLSSTAVTPRYRHHDLKLGSCQRSPPVIPPGNEGRKNPRCILPPPSFPH